MTDSLVRPLAPPRAPTEAELARAIATGELRLHVQPKVDLCDGSVVGVEALVRWEHPELGLLAPDEFLPLAEASGQSVALGDWVLDAALEIAVRWRDRRHGSPMRVWVNLATQQLEDGAHLCRRVRDALDSGRITAHSLGFEVTESSLLADLPAAVGVLSTLRGLGVEIALDDFGTGYSSLWYLRQLPVTAVKIDRSFVAGIGGSLADEAIVAAVVDLAHALGLRVVAEGVEHAHQADALITMGAERAQGFWFARPAPADEIEPLLGLAWCGAGEPHARRHAGDARAEHLPGYGSPRARLLLTALDSACDSIVVTTATEGPAGSSPIAQQIVYANAAFESETGFAARDVIGESVRLLLGDDAVRHPLFSSDASDADRAVTMEITCRRADGSTFPCETTLSPIIDERGVHTHWLHVRRDLTARHAQAEADRRRAELSGFVSQLAQRVLDVGRDTVLADLDSVLRDLAGLVGADVAWLDAIDRDAGLIVPQGGWTGPRCPGRVVPARIEIAGMRAWLDQLETGAPLFFWTADDAETEWMREQRATFASTELRTRVYASLRVGGETIGVLGLGSVEPPLWDADEIGAVQRAADAFANLLGRRRAEEAVRTSEARLSALLGGIGDLLVVVDRRGRVRYVNSRVEEVLGYHPSELVDREFLWLVHPDDRGFAVDAFTKTLAGDELPVVELRVLDKDGGFAWFDIDTKGTEDPLVGGYLLSLRNVTLQRTTQQSDERRVAHERVVLELSQWALEVEGDDIVPGLGAHLERLGRTLSADSAFAALLEGEQVRNVAGWKVEGSPRLSYAFPAGDVAVPAIVRRYRTLEPLIVSDIDEHDEDWADEWRRFPVPDRAGLNVPLVSSGRCLGNIGVAMARSPRVWEQDEIALVRRVSETVAAVLARHRAEESVRTSEARLAALLDGSQDIVAVVGVDGTMHYVNRTTERALGYTPDDLVGRNVAMLLHPDDWDLAFERLVSLERGDPTPMTCLRLIASDGSVGWWEVTSGVAPDPVAGGRVLSCRDVTERLDAQRAAEERVAHLRYAFDVAQSALDLGPAEFLERLDDVCATIGTMLDADLVYVDRLDAASARLVNVGAYATRDAAPALQRGESVPLDAVPAWIDRLSSSTPVVARDVALCDEAWADDKRQVLDGERSLMAMGMTAAGELFGVLGVSMLTRSRHWTDDELTFLRVIAETIAHVLERARLDDALRASESRFRLLSETAADVVVLVDATGTITYVSPSSATLLGFTPEQLVGQTALSMIHPDDRRALVAHIRAGSVHPSFPSETRVLRADGGSVWVASSTSVVRDPATGMPVEFRSSLREITDRKRLEAQLEHQALHDPLTGLGNRLLLRSNLAAATKAGEPQLAVLLLDLDGFKTINDTYGHAVGDEVLQIVAERLSELTRATDTIARTGGDEFVFLCPGIDEAGAIAVGERIVRTVQMPILAGDVTVRLGASVGVAHHRGEGADSDRLLLDADRAMYVAKRAGRGCVRLAGR